MRQIIKYLRAILNFDYRKLEWWQWVIGIAGVVVAIWILGILLNILTSLVAPALVLIALYFGYRMVNSREPLEATADEARTNTVSTTTNTAQTTHIEVNQEQPIAVEIEGASDSDTQTEVAVTEVAVEEEAREEKAANRLSLAEETMMETERIMGQIEARKKRIQQQMDDE